jgi:hypothetical protein
MAAEALAAFEHELKAWSAGGGRMLQRAERTKFADHLSTKYLCNWLVRLASGVWCLVSGAGLSRPPRTRALRRPSLQDALPRAYKITAL